MSAVPLRYIIELCTGVKITVKPKLKHAHTQEEKEKEEATSV
jgi:hypothetical protein